MEWGVKMETLMLNSVKNKENVHFSDLVGSVSASNLLTIKEAIQGRKNVIICGNIGAGKTTVLEAVAREHISCHPIRKDLYLTVHAEINFEEGSNVVTIDRHARNSNLRKDLILANAFNVKTIFIEELREADDYEALLDALELEEMQIVFTMHGHGIEQSLQRVEAFLGEEKAKRFISKFSHVISCSRELSGKRIFEGINI